MRMQFIIFSVVGGKSLNLMHNYDFSYGFTISN